MKSFLARLLPSAPLVFPAILSGVAVTLSFPRASAGLLSFVALVPLFAAVARVRPGRREAFKAGFLFGMACYLTMLWWIVKLIPSADVTIPWLMTPALIALVLYLAVYPAFFLLVTGALARYRAGAFAVMAPALWALFEVARNRGELAFPWGSLGYALSDHPVLAQSASAFGVPGLSFLVVMVNALLAAAFVVRGARARALCAALALLVVTGMALHGRAAMGAAGEAEAAAPTLRLSIVQPNVDLAVKWKPEFKDSTLRLQARLAREAAATGAELVVFPETAVPAYIDRDPQFKPGLARVARELGVPIYIGFLDYRYDGPKEALNIYNSSGLFDPAGRLQRYDKTHLLPFGESLPLASRLRWLRKVDFGQANFQPGPRRAPLDAGAARLTPLICFESVFPYLCARGVREGAQILVNITNDGWFGDTPGPYQHAQMAILRAVEFRRPLVRSANSGVSMVVSPTGEVVAHLGLYQEGIITTDVPLLDTRTIYSRFGDWPLILFSVVLVGAAALWARRREAG
jgi:apolipoprotein N-acyltransferase